MAKRTEQDMIDLCVSFGHTYIGGYVNADIKFNYKCKCGNATAALVRHVKDGGGCKKCKPKRPTAFNPVVELAKLGMELISGYTNSQKLFTYRCSCGNIDQGRLNDLMAGRKCELCNRNRPFTEIEVSEKLAILGLKYVGGYTNANNKFSFICSRGAESSSTLHALLRGHRCMECSSKKALPTEAVEVELSGYGLKLLKPYSNNHTKLMYECTCGGIGHTSLQNLRRGIRCTNCAENKWREFFEANDCSIIEYIDANHVRYKCACGNIHIRAAAGITPGSLKCPQCRVTAFNAYKPKRGNLYSWKKAVLLRDNYACMRCENDDALNVHHIEGYAARPDLADVVSNGIILCNTCHKEIHSLYGHNVGKENLTKWRNLCHSLMN